MKALKYKKGSIILYSLLLILAVAVMYSLKNCNDRHYSVQKIGGSSGDTLDVAIVYSPMSYYIYDDTVGGFNYDMLKQFAHDKKIDVRFWPIISLDDALKKLSDHQFDLLASLPIDQGFKTKFDYTSDIFLDRQVLIQRKDASGRQAVNSSLDLANETIHIEKDSPIEFRIKNLSREIGDTIFIKSHPELSGEYLFLKVASGEIKYAVVNEKITLPLLKHHANVSVNTPISFTQFQAWIVNKQDSTLLKSLNGWIDSIKSTPTYRDNLLRYTHLNSADKTLPQ